MELFLLALGLTCIHFIMISVFKNDKEGVFVYLILTIIFISYSIVGFLSAGGDIE